MVVLNKCCCCFGLRTGTLVIGCLGLTVAIGNLIYAFTLLSMHRDEEFEDSLEFERRNHNIKLRLSSTLSAGIVGILMDASLIYGVIKNLKLMLIPWLTLMGIGTAWIFIYLMFLGSMIISIDVAYGVLIMFLGALIVGIYLYMWLCVLSFYQKLRLQDVANLQRQNEETAMQFISSAPAKVETPPPSYIEYEKKNMY